MRFKKRPVEVEAFCFRIDPYPDWFTDKVNVQDIMIYDDHCIIRTLEGSTRAEYGDWIIKGIKGELYPCKTDIFDATYDQVKE